MREAAVLWGGLTKSHEHFPAAELFGHNLGFLFVLLACVIAMQHLLINLDRALQLDAESKGLAKDGEAHSKTKRQLETQGVALLLRTLGQCATEAKIDNACVGRSTRRRGR